MYLDDRTTLPAETPVAGMHGTYVVEQFLGLGLTAQGYRAQQTTPDRIVALKVLRHDASPVSREHFWHEAQVLREIRDAGITAVPEVYDQQKTGEIQFLAMEYVDRAVFQPIDGRLDPLLEQEALELARQALHVLQALHERVGRTYTDMQLKNFYWDAAAQRLKILDWNHVSTQRDHIQLDELHGFGVETFEALAQRDLARFGAYFYRLLTGKGAVEQGETARALERRADEQWGRISVAVRQIVRRALHPDLVKRYPTAADFLKDVTNLQASWQEEPDEDAQRQAIDDLLEQAKEATAAQPEARQKLDEVDARLDLLERRGIDLPGYRRRLERLTQGVSAAWGSGSLYYQAEQYAKAAEIWEPEAVAQGRFDLWRWVLLAQSGALDSAAFASVREALEQVAKDLDKDDLMSVTQRWAALKTTQPWVDEAAVPAHWLGVELDAAQQIQAGRAAELAGEAQPSPDAWDAAATAYEQAGTDLKTIPYAALLREEKGWETLAEQSKALRLRSATYRASDSQAAALRQALETDFIAGLALAQVTLLVSPGATSVLALCEQYAREQQASDPAHALAVLDTALLYGTVTDSTRASLQDLRKELQAAVKFFHQLDAALKANEWAELQQIARMLPPEMRSVPRYTELLKDVIATYEARLAASDLVAARQLDRVLTLLDKSSPDRQQALQDLQQQQARAILEERVKSVEANVRSGKWETLRSLVDALPTELHGEARHTEMVTRLTQAYQRHLTARTLWDARQAHEALQQLDAANSKARTRELMELERQFQQNVDALQSTDSSLRLQIVEDERKRIEAEQARKATEAHAERIKSFLEWNKEQYSLWEDRKNKNGAAVYPDTLKEVEDDLRSLDTIYKDLASEKIYQYWKAYLEQQKKWLDEQIVAGNDSQARLDEAERQLAIVRQAGMMTADSLVAAQKARQQAEERLNFQPPKQHEERHTQLRAQVVTLGKLLQANESAARLDEVERQLDAAVRRAGALTADSLTAAQEIHQQAEERLKYLPPKQHEERHKQLQMEAATLGVIIQNITQNGVVPNLEMVQSQVAKFQKQLDEKATEKDLLVTLGALSVAWARVHNGIGGDQDEFWLLAKRYFPVLGLLEQRVSAWVTFGPFSSSGQGQQSPRVLLIPSLDSSAFKEELQSALTTTQTSIINHLDTRSKALQPALTAGQTSITNHIDTKSKALQTDLTTAQMAITSHFDTNLQPLQSLPHRMEQLEKKTRVVARRALAFTVVAVALSVALLVLIWNLMGQGNQLHASIDTMSTQVAQLSAMPTLTPTTGTMTPTPVDLTAAATATLKTGETPTISPTAAPTNPTATLPPPTSISIETFTGGTVTWTQGISLSNMPELTLTATSGWAITLSKTVLQAVDSQNNVTWTVAPIITITNNNPVLVTGTWEMSGTTAALWRPDTPTLLPAGNHQVVLQLRNDAGEDQAVDLGSLTIDPLYTATIQRFSPIDPGAAVPGMIGVYTITNTGNISDEVWLSFVDLSTGVVSVELTITTSPEISITKILPPLDPADISFHEAVSITNPTDKKQYPLDSKFKVLLPRLAPGATLQLSAFVHQKPNVKAKGLFSLISNASGDQSPFVLFTLDEGFKIP